MRRFALFSFVALLAIAAACGGNGPLFTLNGEPVTEEQLRTEFRAAASERVDGADMFDTGCRAVGLKDDQGVIEFATALVNGDIGDGIESGSLDLGRLYDILRRECRRFEV